MKKGTTYKRLDFAERCAMKQLIGLGYNLTEIARMLDRDQSGLRYEAHRLTEGKPFFEEARQQYDHIEAQTHSEAIKKKVAIERSLKAQYKSEPELLKEKLNETFELLARNITMSNLLKGIFKSMTY